MNQSKVIRANSAKSKNDIKIGCLSSCLAKNTTERKNDRTTRVNGSGNKNLKFWVSCSEKSPILLTQKSGVYQNETKPTHKTITSSNLLIFSHPLLKKISASAQTPKIKKRLTDCDRLAKSIRLPQTTVKRRSSRLSDFKYLIKKSIAKGMIAKAKK